MSSGRKSIAQYIMRSRLAKQSWAATFLVACFRRNRRPAHRHWACHARFWPVFARPRAAPLAATELAAPRRRAARCATRAGRTLVLVAANQPAFFGDGGGPPASRPVPGQRPAPVLAPPARRVCA